MFVYLPLPYQEPATDLCSRLLPTVAEDCCQLMPDSLHLLLSLNLGPDTLLLVVINYRGGLSVILL